MLFVFTIHLPHINIMVPVILLTAFLILQGQVTHSQLYIHYVAHHYMALFFIVTITEFKLYQQYYQ